MVPRPRRPIRLTPSLLLLALGCTPAGDSAAPPQGELDTVVIFTMDAVHSRYLLGNEGAWNTAPNIQAFLDENVHLVHAISPRGLTTPALSTMLTGAYPRTHGVRKNNKEEITELPTLPDTFRAKGWKAYGYSATQGQILDDDWDESNTVDKPEPGEDVDQQGDDRDLTALASARLAALDADERALFWLHTVLPHNPYEAVEPWYSEFHPQPYEGTIDVYDDPEVYQVVLGRTDFDAEDLLHFEAVYASGIRETDQRFGELMQALEDSGRADSSLVVFGVDHGEELFDHHDYCYHGCSAYNAVVDVTYGLGGAGLPRAVALQGPVSTADIAPTVLELVGFEQHGMTIEGQSLVDAIQQGQAPDSPVFFERGTDSAGVIHGDHKLILTPAEAFSSCIPYSQSDGDAFPAELEELYDLAADPGELNNLAETERELLGELRDTTCSWVQQSAFEAEHAMDNNLLVAYCEEHGHPRP